MCLRLFLNGDNNTQGAYMSLYLVLMRTDHNANLSWPFNFKTNLTLINQSQPDNNYCKSFWSDPASASFQLPMLGMNTPYGFSKFIPLRALEDSDNHFLLNDTIILKAEIDFNTKISGKLIMYLLLDIILYFFRNTSE